MSIKKWSLAAILLSCSAVLWPAENASLWKSGKPNVGERDFGLILNTADMLLNLESYQGGIGTKIGIGDFVLRPAADILLNTGINPFSLTLGLVLEMHFLPGPVSVYWGPSLQTGFTILTNKIDADNWSQVTGIEMFTAGAVCGIELFIFDFLSIFVEYQLAINLGLNIYRTSLDGVVSSNTEFTYKLDLGLGNNTMIGVVFYLMRKGK